MTRTNNSYNDPPPNSKNENVVIDNEHVFVTVSPQVYNMYNVYLLEQIHSQGHYRELLDLIRCAESGELINIFINNHGGSMSTGIDLINSVKASNAEIVVHITGPLYSMAPLIALQGDKINLENNSFMMFHDYSTLQMGKGSEIEAHTAHFRKFAYDCFSQWTKGFLTKKEVDSILEGKDLYLNYEQCKERIQKMGKLFIK